MKTVYYDLETGGLEVGDPIIQIAAIAVDSDYKEIETFERKLLFNESDASPEALELNSYDRKVWEDAAVPPDHAAHAFGVFLNRHAEVPMVSRNGRQFRVAQMGGYNSATFDAPRLQHLYKTLDMFLPGSFRNLDVLQLVQWHFHLIGEYHDHLKLADACRLLGVKLVDAHDALGDVRATVEVVKVLAGRS